jgi:hypothetical protein
MHFKKKIMILSSTIRRFLISMCVLGGFYISMAQPVHNEITVTDLLNVLNENRNAGLLSDSSLQALRDKLLKDPSLYNSAWQRVLNLSKGGPYDFLKDLHIQFKTFQSTDTNRVSLGLSYNWDFNFTKQSETQFRNSGLDLKLKAEGNIAFNKKINPADFLSTKLVFDRHSFGGGFVNKPPRELKDSLTAIKMRLAEIDDENEVRRSPLWGQLLDHFRPRNHYYFDIDATGGLESNQDFTKKQWAYGAEVAFSIKSYDDNNPLSQFNLFDYPFALIRKLTDTDADLTPYGASFPSFMAGIDLVKPDEDVVRKTLLNNLKPFGRLRFEAGFRTLVAQLSDNTIFFNADFRVYKELSAPTAIKQAKLDRFIYFASSLTSNKGFFVSYAYGKLPFDAQNDAIYSIGFQYDF